MAHPYKKDADEGHARKLKAYGGETGKAPLTHAGFPALNTDQQAGRAPLNSKEYVPPEVTARTARKKGGKVMGAQSLKRLDKAPRGKHATGARKGPVPTGTTEQVDFDVTNTFEPGKMNERSLRKCGGRMKKEDGGGSFLKRTIGGPKPGSDLSGVGKETTSSYSDEDKAGLQSRIEGSDEMPKDDRDITAPYKKGGAAKKRAAGGKAMHDDEAMDRKLIDKMVKKDALTGKSCGGSTRTKRADGGGAWSDYGASEGGSKSSGGKKGSAKTNVTIIVGAQPQPSMSAPQGAGAGLPPEALAALLGGAGGPPPAAPPQMPPPGAGAPPMMASAPPPQMPPQMPPPGAGGPGPMPRKDGGAVQVKYRKPSRKDDYPAMDFGSGGGFGRKQKIDSYGTKGPKGDSV